MAEQEKDNLIDYEGLGRRVKSARRRAGIRQADLAKKLGISYQYMSMIETGKRKLSLGMLVSLANELWGLKQETKTKSSFLCGRV